MMSLPSASCTSTVDSGVKKCAIAVEMRAKQDAFFGDFAEAVQAEYLESAGIGENALAASP